MLLLIATRQLQPLSDSLLNLGIDWLSEVVDL